MGLLNKKVVLVTGGTKGIGLEIVKKFLSEEATVITCARNIPEEKIKNVDYFQLDVSDSLACKNTIESILNKYGKIDVLVANAGITKDAMTYKMTDEMFDDVININLKGIFNVVRYVGPTMENNGTGSIITISSIVGQYGNIGQVNYAASKAGIIGMTKSWAKEFSRKGKQIRVNSIAPGYILTDMVKSVPEELLKKFSDQTMLKRLGEPEEIANAALFLASDLSTYITGTVLDVNGGMRL
ncbi:MAG: 3-oxoacyl-ACP reductase FabG [Bacilli bacterium]|jgi:3-oxoacyl-[acyl-carrier protein] reductase|nr:3-oxoacyl-ACP reductase FabG [Bacilli bacterium]